MSQRKPIGLVTGVVLAGLSIGATETRAAPSSRSSVASAKAPGRSGKQRAAKVPQCPLRPGQDWPEAEDQEEATRYRHAILEGIFKLWIELGRAPTPEEFAQRMKLTQPEANRLLNEMQACGESTEAGILRAPTSELIANRVAARQHPHRYSRDGRGGKARFRSLRHRRAGRLRNAWQEDHRGGSGRA